MRIIIIIIILILPGTNVSAQTSSSTISLDRIEKLLSRLDIEYADSLLMQKQLDFGSSKSSYREDYIAGLLFYYKKQYEKSISVMSVALDKMDSQQLWDCENYLKTIYYIADSYIHLDKMKESETIINNALVKCVNSYNKCFYAKKIFQLLLAIYNQLGYSSAVIEQVHNEIQKIAINIYASDNSNKDGEDIRERFMFFYNYITSPTLSKEDSLNMYQGKAAYLYSIGEYEEAIRLYEKVKIQLPKFDQQLKGINESLLVMYSSTAQMDNTEKLLHEMYEYSTQMKLDYDPYSLNIWVGHNLNQNGHFKLAQLYYENCDSILNANRSITEWEEKKGNILTKMVFNSCSLGAFEKVIKYCKEYADFFDKGTYDELFFIYYHQGLALRGLEKFEDAIKILEKLKIFIQKNNNNSYMDYIMVNVILGVCYYKTNRINESLECASTAVDVYKRNQIDNKSLLGTMYNNIGKAYLQKGAYKKALPYLNLSADIQIEQTGAVSKDTQYHIDKCKIQQK